MSNFIDPKNLTAQLAYKASGNPPGAHPDSAVGNFFPGLEFNFLNVWKRLFVGIELLEARGIVLRVDDDAGNELKQLVGTFLISVDGKKTWRTVIGPKTPGGTTEELGGIVLEWGNILTDVHQEKGGTENPAECIFYNPSNSQEIKVSLKVRRLMEPGMALISKEAVKPGEITESLCSPWQTDFIGCACYYWAANRPDYVNVWSEGNHSGGHNWLNQDRENREVEGLGTKPFYTLEPGKSLEHEDIMQNWEQKLRFIIGGKDEK